MSIKKVKQRYYFEFMVGGKTYRGVCSDCKSLEEARKFRDAEQARVKKMRAITKPDALLIQYRKELTGAKEVYLDEAFDAAMNKPTVHRIRTAQALRAKRRAFEDFVAFMKFQYPDIKELDEVLPVHAQAYVAYLQKHGTFEQRIKIYIHQEPTMAHRSPKLANRTINQRISHIDWVFRKLAQEMGTPKSPFDSTYIERMRCPESHRTAFTLEELAQIGRNFDKMPFVRPLFIIAAYTALREGDICTLRWQEVDLQHMVITRCISKTEKTVQIPIIPPLAAFLMEQQQISGGNKYVLPEHAMIYSDEKTRCQISQAVKKFLTLAGIQDHVKQVEGYGRRVSVKDLHSVRHTFCTLAEQYGIPHNIVQNIVGHSTAAMTAHYARHVNIEAIREQMLQLPDFLTGKQLPRLMPETAPEPEREELLTMIRRMNIQQVKELLQQLQTAENTASNQ